MASSSKASSRARWIGAVATLAILGSGCWTGLLVESGRLHERVARYERISIDGEKLLLDYTVGLSRDARSNPSTSDRLERRAVLLRLADLFVTPPYTVDAFPLERIAAGSCGARTLPMRIVSRTDAPGRRGVPSVDPLRAIFPVGREGGEDAWPLHRSVGASGAGPRELFAEIAEHDGQHLGFRLCPLTTATEHARFDTLPARLERDCRGDFYSAALYEERFAWWIYPIAPISLAVDIALVPIQLITLPPLLVLSD